MSDTLYLQLDQIFNHFGHMKITDDPTPMQIQMRLYEENVNKTLIKDIDRTSEK